MTMDTRTAPIEILLVEDNPGDVRLTREALTQGKVWHNLHVAASGAHAFSYLLREGAHQDAPRPDLILLDLDLPGIDGRAVLEHVKADDELSRIPVVVLTASKAQQDVQETYKLHANCYVTKPVDFDQFIGVVKAVEHFWLCIVKLPPKI
ncbi:MAG: response regulator [Dehalococcoidia bacterium]